MKNLEFCFDLTIGDEVFFLYKEVIGKRPSVTGAGSGLVVSRTAEGFRVRVLARSGTFVETELELRRIELYRKRNRDEHAAFGALVRQFWGDGYRGENKAGRAA